MSRKQPQIDNRPTHTEVKPPTKRALDREAALSGMRPELEKEFQQIEQWFETQDTSALTSRHELGVLAKRILEGELNRDRGHGQPAARMMALALGEERSREVQEARRFADCYTQDEVVRLAKIRLDDGRALSYSLLRLLCQIDRIDEREQMLKRVVAEAMTATELGKVVRERFNRPTTNRGAKPKLPRTLDAAVKQQESAVDALLNRATKVWHSDEHSLTALASAESSAKVNFKQVEQLKALEKKLLESARAMEEQAKEARRTYTRILARLSRRGPDDITADDLTDQAETAPRGGTRNGTNKANRSDSEHPDDLRGQSEEHFDEEDVEADSNAEREEMLV